MGMSDCVKCWETPCACGHEYEDWSIDRLREQIKMLQGILAKKTGVKPLPAYPEGEFDVKYQHSSQIRNQLSRMITERAESRMIELCLAEVVGSGTLSFIRDCEDPAYCWLQVNSATEYRLPKTDLTALNVTLGDRLVVFRHHKMLYVVKAVINLAAKKLPLVISELTVRPLYNH